MNNWKLYFLFVVLLLVCAECLSAQPGYCKEGSATSEFDPRRACNANYFSEEFVFVGRVISADMKVTEVKNHPAGFVKVSVAVETPLKGKPERNIELFLDRTCYKYLESGDKRIFTARWLDAPGFSGLASYAWSKSLKDISKNDLAEIVKEIRSVVNGIKQPRIVGKLVQYDSGPGGRAGFSGDHLYTKLGYDPDNGRPLAGIEIIAVPVDGNINPLKQAPYKTKTNSDGSFQFKDLPAGFYVLSPALPDNLELTTFIYKSRQSGKLYESGFESVSGKYNYVTIGDGICSEDVRFNVRPPAK